MKYDLQFGKMFYFQNLLAHKSKCIVWQRISGEQRPDFHNVKYFARANFAKAICLATTNTTTEILHQPARSLLLVLFFHHGCQKGKWQFLCFLSSCNRLSNLSLVFWYLCSVVDKLVKIQGRETETEKVIFKNMV